MRYYSILFLAFVLVACAPYNDDSWNKALEKFQSSVESAIANNSDSLVQTDISDIQWSLVYNNEEENNGNNSLPANLLLNNNGENQNNNSNGFIGLKIEITNANTNANTTLTYKLSDAVNIPGTSVLILASEEDLNSTSNLLSSTKILRIDTNEEIVDETTSGTTHIISGTIQRITGLSGLNLLNQLTSDEPGLLLTSEMGKIEAFFLLRIEYPLPNSGQTNYTLSYSTYLMQLNTDGTWTQNIITNQ